MRRWLSGMLGLVRARREETAAVATAILLVAGLTAAAVHDSGSEGGDVDASGKLADDKGSQSLSTLPDGTLAPLPALGPLPGGAPVPLVGGSPGAGTTAPSANTPAANPARRSSPSTTTTPIKAGSDSVAARPCEPSVPPVATPHNNAFAGKETGG